MPSKKAKAKKFEKKRKAAAVKQFKKTRSRVKKIKRTKSDGFEYNEYILKKELDADDR
jgi:hypothetical protein